MGVARREYSDVMETGSSQHKHTMGYYDQLLEEQEIKDILRNIRKHRKVHQKYKWLH